MTLAAFRLALQDLITRLSKVTSAAKAKALVPELNTLVNQVTTLVPAITERRHGMERRTAKDAGTQQRRRGQRRLVTTGSGMSLITITGNRLPAPPVTESLSFTVQPPASVTNDVAFTVQPVLQLRTAAGAPKSTSGVTVTASVVPLSVGASAVLGGDTTKDTNGSGVATFTDLKITGTAGAYVLVFSATDYTDAIFNTLVILAPSIPAKAGIRTAPAGAVTGVAFTTQPIIEIQDASGNLVDVSAPNVIVTITSGSGSLIGIVSVAPVAGVVTFSGLGITGTGNFTLTFTPTGLTPITAQVTVQAAGSSAIAIATQPSGGGVGSPFPTQPGIQLVIPATSYTCTGTTTENPLSDGSKVAAIAGGGALRATGGTIRATSLYSAGFSNYAYLTPTGLATVGPNQRASLTISTWAAGNGAEVMIRNQNSREGYSFGVQTDTQAGIWYVDASGTYNTLSAFVNHTWASGDVPSLEGDGSTLRAYINDILKTTVTDTRLTSGRPAWSITANTSVDALLIDNLSGGELATNVAQANIGITASKVSGPGNLTGTLTALTNANGLATFTNLGASAAGSYVIRFTSGAFTVDSATVVVTSGAATQLVVTTEPGGAVDGAAFIQQPSVQLRDANNVAVATAGVTITASLAGASSFTVGARELLYTNATMPPDYIDFPLISEKNSVGGIDVWQAQDVRLGVQGITRWRGTLADPYDTFLGLINVPTPIGTGLAPTFDMNGFGATWQPWISGIYKIDATKRLAFTHVEKNPAGAGPPSSCGLAYSTDSGASWLFLGEIAKSVNEDTIGLTSPANYLIINDGGTDYFYCYVNDNATTLPPTHINVIRAPVAAVLQAAALGTVTTWVKYSGGGVWNTNALTQAGFDVATTMGLSDSGYISMMTCGAGQYNTALGKYILTTAPNFANPHTERGIWLLTTTDGLTFEATQIEAAPNSTVGIYFPGMASLSSGTADDMHIIGSDFYVYWTEKPTQDVADYHTDTYYRRHITINQTVGSGTLGGTLAAVTNTSGTATWPNLSIANGGVGGNFTLRFTQGALTEDSQPLTVTPTAPPSANYPNRPASCPNVMSPGGDFNLGISIPPSPPAANDRAIPGGGGWAVTGPITTSSDPTDPVSPPGVLDFQYPPNGTSPGAPPNTYANFSAGKAYHALPQVTELYIAFPVWHDANATIHPISNKMCIVNGTGSPALGLNLESRHGSVNWVVQAANYPTPGFTTLFEPNVSPGPSPIGAWRKLEIHIKLGPGGWYKLWIDGAAVINETGLNLPTGLSEIFLDGTWGGGGGFIGQVWHRKMGHIFIAHN